MYAVPLDLKLFQAEMAMANAMFQTAEADGFPVLDLADYLCGAPGAM